MEETLAALQDLEGDGCMGDMCRPEASSHRPCSSGQLLCTALSAAMAAIDVIPYKEQSLIADITPISQIDWDHAGARFYHVPFTLDHTWGRVRVPLYVACAAQPGTTIVAIGGTHGDEYEGPVGLKNLIHELDPARLVAGRLIVMPVLNVPAFRAGAARLAARRQNMNRVFPGDASGTITAADRALRDRRGAGARRRGDRPPLRRAPASRSSAACRSTRSTDPARYAASSRRRRCSSARRS